ncbi:MAG TPA: XRE family transcriptional regulator [Legionella sp.]|nr:XRE family transcriptional regulator [Legionella sp.]
MNLKDQIASRITKARKAKGITIKELSARIGTLSAARISNWEQATRSPGPSEAKLMAGVLHVSPAYLLCLTDNPKGELTLTGEDGARFVPVLMMKEAPHAKEMIQSNAEPSLLFDDREKAVVVDHFNKSNVNACLFAVTVEDSSMQPEFSPGDLVVIDAERAPNPGDHVLAYFPPRKQTVLRKYGEAEGCLFQLLANNELWATVNVKGGDEAVVCGVVVEHRRYL